MSLCTFQLLPGKVGFQKYWQSGSLRKSGPFLRQQRCNCHQHSVHVFQSKLSHEMTVSVRLDQDIA